MTNKCDPILYYAVFVFRIIAHFEFTMVPTYTAYSVIYYAQKQEPRVYDHIVFIRIADLLYSLDIHRYCKNERQL